MADPTPTPEPTPAPTPAPAPSLAEQQLAATLALVAANNRLADVQAQAAGAFTDPAWSLTFISALLLPTMVQKHETLETAIPLTVSAAFKLVDELAGRVL